MMQSAAPTCSAERLWTISETCKAFCVTARALRLWEGMELIFPIRRGSHRFYSRRDRARITLILRGKRFGLTLEQCRQLLNAYDKKGEVEQLRDALPILRDQLRAIGEQIDQLWKNRSELLHFLESAGAWLERPEAMPSSWPGDTDQAAAL